METKLKYEIKSGVLRLELAGNYLEHIDDGAVQSLCEAAEKQTVTAICKNGILRLLPYYIACKKRPAGANCRFPAVVCRPVCNVF